MRELIALAFLIGAVTSSVSAFLGMKIATQGNVRTAMEPRPVCLKHSMSRFVWCRYGFGLVGLAVFGLITMCWAYGQFITEHELLMEMVAGFGLGGSSVALFGRVGGGIYTKAADVGADLVGKVEQGIQKMIQKPCCNRESGDNVGDIAEWAQTFWILCGSDLCRLGNRATSAAILAAPLLSTIPSSFRLWEFPLVW